MEHIKDTRGFNQVYRESKSLEVRTGRRVDYIIGEFGESRGGAKLEVLEIGCGTGGISYQVALKAGINVLGTDLCVPFIERARERYRLPNLRYEILDFNDKAGLDALVGSKRFDAVFGNGILHHLYYSLDESLANINRLLNPGGRIIFLEPNFYNPYCLAIFNIPIFRRLAKLEPAEMSFTGAFIRGKLAKAGFTAIKVEYKDFLLPGLPYWLVAPVIFCGSILEKIPLLKAMSQSIFISAMKSTK